MILSQIIAAIIWSTLIWTVQYISVCVPCTCMQLHHGLASIQCRSRCWSSVHLDILCVQMKWKFNRKRRSSTPARLSRLGHIRISGCYDYIGTAAAASAPVAAREMQQQGATTTQCCHDLRGRHAGNHFEIYNESNPNITPDGKTGLNTNYWKN